MACECDEVIDPSEFIARINSILPIVHKACGICPFDRLLSAIKEIRYELLKTIVDMRQFEKRAPNAGQSKDDIEREIFCLTYEKEQDELKIQTIRQEWHCQQKNMAELQENLFKANRQLSLHSNYSTTQGSCLAGILAKSLVHENVLKEIIGEQEFLDFLEIAEGCLQSFINVYQNSLPENTVNDYQYALALCKAASNIALYSDGRQFLVQNSDGRKLIRRLVKLTPLVKCPTGETIKLTLIDTLISISIEEEGAAFLQMFPGLQLLFSDCFTNVHTRDITKKFLELLTHITHYLCPKSEFFFNDFEKRNWQEKLKQHVDTGDSVIKKLAATVISNLKKAKQYFITYRKTLKEAPSHMQPCICKSKGSLPRSGTVSDELPTEGSRVKIKILRERALSPLRITSRSSNSRITSCSSMTSRSSNYSTTRGNTPTSQVSKNSSSRSSIRIRVKRSRSTSAMSTQSDKSESQKDASCPQSCSTMENSSSRQTVPVKSCSTAGKSSQLKVISKPRGISKTDAKHMRQTVITRTKSSSLKERLQLPEN